MPEPIVVSSEDWLAARRDLLAKEKELTRLRDEISAARRALPWVEITTEYVFDTPDGPVTLAQLFGEHDQLVVQHFMFGTDWEEGCVSCSFWADSYSGTTEHLAHRDVRFVAISKAPLPKLLAYKQRMGWDFDWFSSANNHFNEDFNVTFPADVRERGEVFYNFAPSQFPSEEAPGVSVFARRDGRIFHTYSAYSRGLDLLNSAYNYIDLTPKGRDEASLEWPMAWLRRRDQY
ncbi:MAG: DUF899 domain-containing protein [Myxococcales bacterium]|nr:DUF899 domain-containing protein [Myxococcales bacterium]